MGKFAELPKMSTVLADCLAAAIKHQKDCEGAKARGFSSALIPKDRASMLLFAAGYMVKHDPEASALFEEMAAMVREEMSALKAEAAA